MVGAARLFLQYFSHSRIRDSEAEEMYIHTNVERTTPVAEQYKLTSRSLLRPTLAKSCRYIPRTKSAATELVSNACLLTYPIERIG